jgi:SulP family sulfate permease
MLFLFLGVGFFKLFTGDLHQLHTSQELAKHFAEEHKLMASASLFILLRAFSSGAVVLSGVEAISNGVSVFHSPAGRNARRTLVVMSTILGILAGLLTYFGLATQDPALLEVSGNPLVIGTLGAAKEGYFSAITGRWNEIGELRLGQVAGLLGSALTLAALLSIDTLKTCVVIDQLTRTRHDSNRELVAQGIANVASAAVGGIAGAGTMGATLVNLSSGAKTRVSGVLEGLLALVAALILGSFLAWVPVATLAGILIVIGVRMLDREPLRFIESRATVFDFAVVLVVVVVVCVCVRACV